jgi:hypothetical protein
MLGLISRDRGPQSTSGSTLFRDGFSRDMLRDARGRIQTALDPTPGGYALYKELRGVSPRTIG